MTHKPTFNWRAWLPSPGNVLFTLLALALFYGAQQAGAFPSAEPAAPTAGTSKEVIPYQGYLTNAAGQPLNSTVAMTFTLYTVASGGSAQWTEAWPSVTVRDGLFNVMLGDTTALPNSVLINNSNLWLGVKVGSDAEMTPRVKLGSAPFARAMPSGSITTTMLMDGAVTYTKAPKLIGAFGSNLKLLQGTFVGTTDADGLANVDISTYGFAPDPIILVTNGDDSAAPNAMIHLYQPPAGNPTYFQIRCWRNNAVCANTLFRVNYVVIGPTQP